MKSVRALRAGSSCSWAQARRRAFLLRGFHSSRPALVVKPYLLADIGEGIREVQIIQWFVKPGARVEQFQALCEVQSDKATVEITSRFDGIVKKLHYEADDMAQVGKALCDIDIQSEITAADAEVTEAPSPKPDDEKPSPPESQAPPQAQHHRPSSPPPTSKHERHKTLATPAVRHLCQELKVSIADVPGTGKDGRVLKEDVQRFASGASNPSTSPSPSSAPAPAGPEEEIVSLTPIQNQMFKAMTRSLSIPHFLYTDSIDTTQLTSLRHALAAQGPEHKISALAFIIKATSLALAKYPIMNARVDTSGANPRLVMRRAHHVGIAVDTPAGLLVPVVRNAQALSVREIASEVSRLGAAGRAGKLSNADLTGGTFTVSNVGSIGGGAVAPVLVDTQVAILGVGRARIVPSFGPDGTVVPREECVFSWSADHRVVDGATAARCAEEVKRLVERPQEMAVLLR